MEREIKFRGWKVRNNEWLSYEVTPSTALEGNYESYSGKIIWNQYTGLKDKNGKEIYEGDILHLWNEYDSGKRVIENGCWEIYWRHDRWHLRNGKELYDNGDFYYGDECEWGNNRDTVVEVVGNIYENPELLNLSNTKEK